jgi:DNA repair exonuclease SbcCD ATPase subunit
MPTISITAKQFANFQEQLAALQNELQAHSEHLSQMRAENLPGPTFLLKELEAKLLAAESQLGELSAKSTAIQKQLEAKLLAAESHLGELLAKNTALQKQLDAVSQSRPRIGVADLLQQFRNNLDGINKAVTEGREKRGVVVDQMEVEVKGGLELKEGIQLTQLLPQEVTPASVSTIRFSLRPTSTIKIVEET